MNIIENMDKEAQYELVTTIERSDIWGILVRRIALLCEQGRIASYYKEGKYLVDSGRCRKACG